MNENKEKRNKYYMVMAAAAIAVFVSNKANSTFLNIKTKYLLRCVFRNVYCWKWDVRAVALAVDGLWSCDLVSVS